MLSPPYVNTNSLRSRCPEPFSFSETLRAHLSNSLHTTAVATGFVCVVFRGGGSSGGLALQRPTQLYIRSKRNNFRSCCITDCPRMQALTRPGGKLIPPLLFKPLAPR